MSDAQPQPFARTTAHPRGWRKSTYSDHGAACVEVNTDADPVLVRDTKYTGPADKRPIIAVPANAWPTFLAAALGEHTYDPGTRIPVIEHNQPTGETSLTDAAGTVLAFTQDEWDAFLSAVRQGEFTLPTLTSV
ncbi:DUF397 domain-containing protein [Nocardia brevicatena]|uniref:DUF397 domain-containing protein n=1 Tax=Nocardia brevicatena TaxID=37327 RepID=UPI00031D264B|nr:DUF397 domain-containing protein [Nocardia brevicatena]